MSYASYATFAIGLRSVGARDAAVEVISSPVGELRPASVELPRLREGVVSGAEPPIDEADLKALGVALFDSLLPAPARALYRAALASLPVHSGLRLLVQTDAPRLAAIPWEYCYDSELGVWPALDPRTPLVRYYALPFVRDEQPRPAVLRALVVLAAPTDQASLDFDSERRRLEATLGPLQQTGRLELHYLESPVTVERLQNTVRRGFDLLHYVGHGTQQSGQGVLLLERDDRQTHLVPAEEVAMLLRRTEIRLVCLNACQTGAAQENLFSGLGPALVQAEIPAVVAMQYSMPDQSALRFTRAFYAAVADGEPVDAAMTAARIALRTNLGPGSPDWGYPALFMRAASGHLWSDHAEEAPKPAAVCPSCGRSVLPTARHCGNCGAALTTPQSVDATRFCPGCGAPVRAQARFCASCGVDLRLKTSSQPGGVQISGEAKVTGIVAGQDANITLSGGDLVFGESKRSIDNDRSGRQPQNRRSEAAGNE